MIYRRNSSSPFTEAWIDGVSVGSETTDPTTASPTLTTEVWGTTGGGSGSWGSDSNGLLARCAFWSGTAVPFNDAESFLNSARWDVKPSSWLELLGDSPERDYSGNGITGALTGTAVAEHPPVGPIFGYDNMLPFPSAAPAGRIMSSLARYGGLAHKGGIAGRGGGLA